MLEFIIAWKDNTGRSHVDRIRADNADDAIVAIRERIHEIGVILGVTEMRPDGRIGQVIYSID